MQNGPASLRPLSPFRSWLAGLELAASAAPTISTARTAMPTASMNLAFIPFVLSFDRLWPESPP